MEYVCWIKCVRADDSRAAFDCPGWSSEASPIACWPSSFAGLPPGFWELSSTPAISWSSLIASSLSGRGASGASRGLSEMAVGVVCCGLLGDPAESSGFTECCAIEAAEAALRLADSNLHPQCYRSYQLRLTLTRGIAPCPASLEPDRHRSRP